MRCPYCSCEETSVVDSRPQVDRIKRRRECSNCHKRFTTYEMIEKPLLMVEKKGKSVEVFDRQKLYRGIVTAVKKRPITIEQIDGIIDKIEAQCAGQKKSIISTSDIGNMVLEELRNMDEVAYIRFASVYKEFEDVEGFIKEIQSIKNKIV